MVSLARELRLGIPIALPSTLLRVLAGFQRAESVILRSPSLLLYPFPPPAYTVHIHPPLSYWLLQSDQHVVWDHHRAVYIRELSHHDRRTKVSVWGVCASIQLWKFYVGTPKQDSHNPLHTCLFNLERCNGKGRLLSSGDDHHGIRSYVGMTPKKNDSHIKSAQMTRLKCLC